MNSSDSVDVAFCLQKIDSVIALITRLMDGDYPHRDSKLALDKILDVYVRERKKLLAIDPAAKPDTILEFCRSVNVLIVRLKRFLGLLLRSSNLRNAFEIYFPIKILSTELLERSTCVVLSSEWEFSPFIYPVALDELPEFVFIGIPASECHNPLIIPLAAHELGHVVWRRKGAEGEFAPKIKDQILKLYRDNWADFQSAFNTKVAVTNIESDLFVIRAWKESYNLAMRQLEEMFCDFMGIFIFGASFFYSFRYLISPSLGYKRSAPYPSIAKRAEYMLLAAAHHGITNVGDFAASFNENEIERNKEARFVLNMADKSTSLLVRDLIPLVERYRGKAECFKDGSKHETSGKECLVDLVPIATINSVSAIINAGWSLRLGLKSWDIAKDINDENERNKEKLRVLRDLILKSLEVYEYRKRMEKGNATGCG